MVHVGFGADAALILEGQFEDGIDMTPVRGSLVVPMGQFRTRRHARTSVTRIDEAEAVMRRGISGLGMRRPDGDTFTEIPFTDGNNAVCDRRLGALSTSGVAGAGPGSNITAHRAMATSEGHLIMVWRRLMSGREFGMALMNKDMTCLLSRRQAVHAAQQGRT